MTVDMTGQDIWAFDFFQASKPQFLMVTLGESGFKVQLQGTNSLTSRKKLMSCSEAVSSNPQVTLENEPLRACWVIQPLPELSSSRAAHFLAHQPAERDFLQPILKPGASLASQRYSEYPFLLVLSALGLPTSIVHYPACSATATSPHHPSRILSLVKEHWTEKIPLGIPPSQKMQSLPRPVACTRLRCASTGL